MCERGGKMRDIKWGGVACVKGTVEGGNFVDIAIVFVFLSSSLFLTNGIKLRKGKQ